MALLLMIMAENYFNKTQFNNGKETKKNKKKNVKENELKLSTSADLWQMIKILAKNFTFFRFLWLEIKFCFLFI